VTVLLLVVALGFAWSMGAHYTGACMGMPHALRAVAARRALVIMAPLVLIGASFASHGVERTVGHNLLDGAGLTVAGQVIVLAVAFMLTTVFTQRRIPTSTIQILVFCNCGVALAVGAAVQWGTIGTLAGIWVAAPVVAAAAGYAFTRVLDRVPGVVRTPAAVGAGAGPRPEETANWLGIGLVVVGGIASFAMGANDVANATGALVGTGTLSPLAAGVVGGAGLAVGVLTWGRPLLHKVAFDIVTVDRAMATAAQLVQGVVILVAVAFGYFTSMNQALIGAMAGAGAARGRRSVHKDSVLGIVRGWVVGPAAGLAIGYAAARRPRRYGCCYVAPLGSRMWKTAVAPSRSICSSWAPARSGCSAPTTPGFARCRRSSSTRSRRPAARSPRCTPRR